jgi:alpha-tubulin suppressor-like RCC1 family protein
LFSYDSLNRLIKADYGGGLKISYTYDAAGNRLTYSDLDTSSYVDTRVVAWGQDYWGQTDVPEGLSDVVAIGGGYDHSLALRADGTVVAWGNDNYGQTTVPAGLNNVVAIAGGGFFSLALRADGTVVAWGDDTYGQTTVPAGLSNVVAIAGGEDDSLALRADGTVVAWGSYYDEYHLNYVPMTAPTGLSNVVAIAGGEYHGLALRADGTVFAWGDNYSGQTTVPAGLTNVVAVAGGGFHSLALRADGTVVAWGFNGAGQTTVPPGLRNVVAVAAGDSYSLALRADGTVVAWGSNEYGQTTVPAGLTNVVAVAAGYYHSLACVGSLAPFLGSPLPGQSVVAGATATFRMSATGSWPYAFQWRMNGTNLPGATGNVLVVNNVTSDQAGNYTVVVSNSIGATFETALLTVVPLVINAQPMSQTGFAGGTVDFSVNCQSVLPATYQWQLGGTNLPGATGSSLGLSNLSMDQAGSYSVVVSNSAGMVISSNALLTVVPFTITTQPQSQTVTLSGTASFTVQCESILPLSYQWRLRGTNLPGATSNPLVLANVALSQAGGYTVVVSNSAGSVLSSKAALTVNLLAAWGDNTYGQTTVPAGLSNVVAVAAGYWDSLALRSDGTVVAWDYNVYGETTVPSGLTNVVAVAAGYDHSLALRADGTVVAWGYNGVGQTSVPSGLTNVVTVAGGGSHSLALRADGIVVAWGNNSSGQTTVPAGLSNVVAVAGGSDHSLALLADGTVVAWGDNYYGQTTVPAGLNNVVAVAGGSDHSLALLADGTVVAWGDNSYGQTTVPAGLSNVVAVAAGGGQSLALRADGTVVGWGDNTYGQTNVPSLALPIGGIACGSDHSLAALALGPPFVTSRLADREGSVGGPVFFRVEANGAPPLHYQWRRNGVDLPGYTKAVLQWSGYGASGAGDYSVIVSNDLGVATIPSAKLFVTFVDVQAALNDSLPWNSDVPPQGWFAETSDTHDGAAAAQSGAIGDSQESWLQSWVVGPGTLTFWWKVSSEEDYDFLEFYVDGVVQPGSISGEVPWQQRTFSISAGPHTLRWSYVKDISDSSGQDAGWLDEVTFTPAAGLPQFGGGLSASNGTFAMVLTGAPGASVVVESSLDLVTWTPMQTNTLTGSGLDLAVPMGTNQNQYFRLRILQP